ncbi:MAG: AraC family transcriptional regulator [Phycisphaerales bacterium]|jgi:AraC family transcriptional regulator
MCSNTLANRVGIYSVTEYLYSPGTLHRRHAHSRDSVFIVLSGRVDERSGPLESTRLRSGGGFIPAGVEHESSFGSAPVHGVTIGFDREWARATGIDLDRAAATTYSDDDTLAITSLGLLGAGRQQHPAHTLAVEERIMELLSRTINAGTAHTPHVDARRTSPKWLRTAVDYLSAASGAGVGLQEMSVAVGRNPAHICRAFRAHTGMSVSRYALALRVERAAVLLATTRRPLSMIALDSGFTDQAHLTRCFRSVLGTTPGEYRRSSPSLK